MARIGTFKVEIPTDDTVRFDAIKALLTETIRALGSRTIGTDPQEGQPALDGEAVAFFGAASVKTFVVQPARPKTTRTKS